MSPVKNIKNGPIIQVIKKEAVSNLGSNIKGIFENQF
jgi:hypothetical protein